MQDAPRPKIHVTLMGMPCLATSGDPNETLKRALDDAEVLETLALLLSLVLSRQSGGNDVLATGKDQYADREDLGKYLFPDLFADDPKRARDRATYRLRKVEDALKIRAKSAERGKREREILGLTLDHLAIDARGILRAARQMHDDKNQTLIIGLGGKRLLEGMGYPWLEQPAFQELRQSFDDCYLEALHRKADSQLVLMKGAMELGEFEASRTYRNEAMALIEKGRERLRRVGAPHPLAAAFSALEARAADRPAPTDAAEPVQPPIPSAPRHNIPRRITSFVGRHAETARVVTLLRTQRLVTIKGMGGCGKTRLALQAALEHAERSGEETWLVELAGVTDPALVPQTVAHVLGLAEQRQGTYLDALIGRLRGAGSLLVLDNCEHLLEGCASVVETLVQFCPALTVLATSREPLNIEGEHSVDLAPLPIPPTDFTDRTHADPVAALMEYESARLLIDRLSPHGLAVSNDHVAAIASICASLDGIPLALELAAARASMLSLEEINDLLTDRFQLLAKGRATALPRHKTLRAVIDWSYDLLTEQEQALLCRLSVFAGGWTRDAALYVGASGDHVVPDLLGLLTGLVDKSLIIAEVAASPVRYRMLETVRQYGGDRLRDRGEFSETRGRHRDFFLKIAEEAEPHLKGPAPGLWLDRLEAEEGNFRAALEWEFDEKSLRLACALRRFWQTRSFLREGRYWLERAWDAPAAISPELKARALIGAGNLATRQGNLIEAQRLCEKGLELAAATNDILVIADALYVLGGAMTLRGEYEGAILRLQECLNVSLANDYESGGADARQGLGRIAHLQGDHERAREFYAAAMIVRRTRGDILKLADLLMYTGLLETDTGQYQEARALLNESLAYHLRWRNTHKAAQLLFALSNLERSQGAYVEARARGEQSLVQMRKIGDNAAVATLLNLLAMIAYEEENFQEAEKSFQEARAMMLFLGNQRMAAGAIANLAAVAGKQGKYEQAVALFQESLVQAREFGEWQWVGASLEELGLLEAQHLRSVLAVTLLVAADVILEQTGYHRTPSEQDRIDQALSTLRAALGDDAFASAYEAGRAMTKEQAVAFALEE